MAVSNPTVATYPAPTKDVNGRALPAGAIAKYEVGLGQASGQYTTFVQDIVFEAGATQTTQLPTNLALGTWFASGRAYTVAGPAAWGPEVSFTVDIGVPEKLTAFSVS